MKYYLTTPIYYVNAAPHIGHAYTTIAADAIKRFKRMQGFEAVLTTGSDEHGQKVERAARSAGRSPKEFTDTIAAEFREQWENLGLAIDHFQRTSDPKHHQVVRRLFERCLEAGHIYKGSYTGQYCANCELYVSDAKPGDPCPDCRRPTETVTEENYFFKLSAFKDRLLELYKDPDFIQPETRRNEVIAFVKQGLNDLSITRTTIKWGIPVPVEGNHVFYVWFDALTAYMSAVEGDQLWPADLHLIGKEIVRFHAIYWPAFLMAAGLPLPKRIFAHGWLLFEQDKMSKSRGNIVRAEPIRRVMGADGLRYFLLREIVFGQDGNFSFDALVGRYNSDLANGLGNLASRTLKMIQDYRNGVTPGLAGPELSPMSRLAMDTIDEAIRAFERFEFSRGLESVWNLLSTADKYIVDRAPWVLAKREDDESRGRLDETLYTAAEVLRIASVLLAPVLPESAEKIWRQLGMSGSAADVQLEDLSFGQLLPGQAIGEISPVFPRLDPKLSVERMRALEQEETARQAALMGKRPEAETAAQAAGKISIEDFTKVDMRVGLVLSAERVKGADKLLHLKVDLAEPEPRTIVAGIAEAYRPEQLVGRKVIIVVNLQPRKMRGLESNGMIVAASLEGGMPVLAGFLEDVPAGARLK
jgi:methionyl-tRNA synthetase